MTRLATCAFACVAALAFVGCNEPPGVNPWRDDSIPRSQYGSATSENILAANAAPAIRYRDYDDVDAPQARHGVPHYPLWWEDPFEDQGDGNDEFAWTWVDYVDMPYGLTRFIINTVGWPVSAVVTPPGTPMVSDGVVEKPHPHDAKRGHSPDPVAGPEDFESSEVVAAESIEPSGEPASDAD